MLPPELLEPIARMALEAEGGDVRAWARLSLVGTAWRDALRGEHFLIGPLWCKANTGRDGVGGVTACTGALP